ncbi:hypothetical protein EV694_0182 [Volucribacter psittacicida]|uniref:Elongation factor P hydroxylase n=1 Tax=Volucribacter psittacicida TaxID=203482 RepID=A0A4V2PCK0_9PAST|nr:elongation factor P hydroxylase [Volucribacter psittacicida]TCK01566.1 hypothetical protein EV694_0182 [Volucribacter psittacicida]
MQHHYQDLIRLFNQCFADQYQTKLVKGGDEPIYIPAHAQQPYHCIYFAHGFYSSALHEISHWLVAGKARRQLEDFGYWYEPDGRSAERQREFEKVEVKPQAIEWILSTAAGYRFFASHDNLSGNPGDANPFKQAIYQQVKHYAEQGLPKRTAIFQQALCDFYQTDPHLDLSKFDVSRI